MKKHLMIAGPCAAESREQILVSAHLAKQIGVDYMRVSLWKPRTKPGFEGLGEDGIPLLVEVAQMGLNPGSEVMTAKQVEKLMAAVLPATQNGRLLVWIGARNQNHFIQREIAEVASQSNRVTLMVKNQPWHNKEHWLGIIDHVLAGGIAPENLVICHRGFAMHNIDNPHGLRNHPDYDLAMAVKTETGLPMVFDPSHTGGSVTNVLHIADQASNHAFDGLIVEVHPNPSKALTDAKQQLTWEQFATLKEAFVTKRAKAIRHVVDRYEAISSSRKTNQLA